VSFAVQKSVRPQAAILVVALVATLNFLYAPEHWWKWALAAFTLPVTAALSSVSCAKTATSPQGVFVGRPFWFVAFVLTTALCSKLLIYTGFYQGDVVLKIVGITIGLGLLYFGNQAPKSLIPSKTIPEASARLAAARTIGWLFCLAGAFSLIAWTTLPPEQSNPLVMIVCSALFVCALLNRPYARVSADPVRSD
jgi:hypothetical protein